LKRIGHYQIFLKTCFPVVVVVVVVENGLLDRFVAIESVADSMPSTDLSVTCFSFEWLHSSCVRIDYFDFGLNSSV
jgi:hypothetical protein